MTDGILTKSHAIRPPHPDQSNSFPISWNDGMLICYNVPSLLV